MRPPTGKGEIYCCVCGTQLGEMYEGYFKDAGYTDHYDGNDVEWTNHVRLLAHANVEGILSFFRDPDHDNGGALDRDVILTHPAEHKQQWHFQILNTDRSETFRVYDAKHIFPIHQACIQIATRVFNAENQRTTSRTSSSSRRSSGVLSKILSAAITRFGDLQNRVFRVNGSLRWGGCHKAADYPDEVWLTSKEENWNVSNPSTLPPAFSNPQPTLTPQLPFLQVKITSPLPLPSSNTTPFILSLLYPLSQSSLTDIALNAPLTHQITNYLPPELFNTITTLLHPFRNPSLTPSRVLPPIWWREALIAGTFTPWLWDLNAEACRRYDEDDGEDEQSEDDQKRSDAAVNDESDVEKPASLIDAKVPLGLRNRRRIWGTVEEIFRFGAAKEEEDEVVVEGMQGGGEGDV
ncbi:hypothetical protein MMC14_005529 [Varicellaria rhodocarpa]|nr:hypothetical protein [Varicellaria rhodocarpa]